MTRLYDEHSKLPGKLMSGSDATGAEACFAMKALIYDANELFDFYQQTLVKCLQPGRSKDELKFIQAYQGTIKRLRDPIALMCNRMKHEYREIVSGHIRSQVTGELTVVYRISVSHEGVQKADTTIHQKGGFASIERTLHEIFHGLLRADYKAGQLIGILVDNAASPITLIGPSSLGLDRALAGLGHSTPIVASSEPGRFDGVQLVEDRAQIVQITARKVMEPTRRTIHITVDEAALGTELFL